MLNDTVRDWLTEYANGHRSSTELVSLLFERITEHPEEREDVLAAFTQHEDEQVHEIASQVADLLSQQASREEEILPPISKP